MEIILFLLLLGRLDRVQGSPLHPKRLPAHCSAASTPPVQALHNTRGGKIPLDRRTSISGKTFSGKNCLSGTIFHAIWLDFSMLFDNLLREKVSKREGYLCFFLSRLSKFSCKVRSITDSSAYFSVPASSEIQVKSSAVCIAESPQSFAWYI
jgi:hypothetical protein